MEFGSDFHTVEYPQGGESILNFFPDSNLYVSGRQALLDLAMARGWKRLWVPSYFCGETLKCISRAGIELSRYAINPSLDPIVVIGDIPVNKDDGLLVVNYFGLFDKRTFVDVGCEVVEDHTHNLIGNWAIESNADWCIASLRKTLPVADGGILWSPRKHTLPVKPLSNHLTTSVIERRSKAMYLKYRYLRGEEVRKEKYLNLFRETEEELDGLPVSAISDFSLSIIRGLDIRKWYDEKHKNWSLLHDKLYDCKSINILSPENGKDCPFSLTLQFVDNETRNKIRKSLIEKSVYPAILWTIQNREDKNAQSFGDKMLSIHCDGRYSIKDMETLSLLIKASLI